MNAKNQPQAHPASELFTDIARQILFIETLEERRMDSLDFHEVAVWQVQKALEAAFEAGRKSRNKRTPKQKEA